MLRLTIIAGTVFALLLIGGCGAWRGSKDVETGSPADSVGDGPGIMTGKRGGIVIFQK